MKNINKKIYINSLIFALVSLFLIIFCVGPLLKEIKKNSKDLISARNNIVILNNQTIETGSFEKDYETYKSNLGKIDQLFIDPDNPVNFIKFLEDTAADSQITSKTSLLTSYQDSQNASKGTPQNFIIFQFSSKGEFSKVSDFLKKIETGPYLIEIESLTIQNSETDSKSGVVIFPNNYSSRIVNAVFTIKAFTKKW